MNKRGYLKLKLNIITLSMFMLLTGLASARADITLTMYASAGGDMEKQYNSFDAKTRAQLDKMLSYKVYVSKNRMRTDMYMVTSIVDTKAGKTYMCNNSTQSYSEAPFSVKLNNVLPSQGKTNSNEAHIEDTGEVSMLLGHKVRHFIITSHDARTKTRIDEYIARDFSSSDMAFFKNINQPVLGIPLQINTSIIGPAIPKGISMTAIAKSISTTQIPSNMFDLPLGYTKTDKSDLMTAGLLREGVPAPNFTVYRSDSSPVKLSDYRGKVVMIDFWATWCVPCQNSLPHSQALAVKYKNQGLVVLGVNVWDDKRAFMQWVPAHKSYDAINFLIDTAQNRSKSIASKLYNVTGIPTVYIIGRDGKVVAAKMGYYEDDDAIEKAISSALK